MKKYDVIFRVDAGPGVGLGHLRRCLALAAALREKKVRAIGFLTRQPKIVQDWVPSEFGIETVHKKTVRSELKECAQKMRLDQPRLLIIDHYGYSASSAEYLGRSSEKLVVIDDHGAWKSYPVDAVINHNVYAHRLSYPRSPALKLFLGSRYALIPKEVLVLQKSRTKHDSLKLFVALGGMASSGAFSSVLRAVKILRERVPKLHVWIASGYFGLGSREKVSWITEVKASHATQAMAQAHLAVSAGGITAYELACLGVPSLLVVRADNQRPIVKELKRRGASISVGLMEDLQSEKLAYRIEELWQDETKRRKMAYAGKKIIDGLGAKRLAAEIKKRYLK